MLSWSEFQTQEPELARSGSELLYFFGVGLAFLSTVRKDGGPRVHPVCPVISEDRLLAFLIPSPKLRDLRRDRRYALHSYPLPENEDVFYLTGRVSFPDNDALRNRVARVYADERHWAEAPADFGEQTLVEFGMETCLLTRTTGHGDPNPRHTVWKAPE